MRNIDSSSRRGFLRTAGAAALLPRAASAAEKPNVIVVLTDDQGYGDFSCHGNPVLKTPAMDRLHSESVRFTQFHSAPMCTPTRGQLMSGQDALRNGATSVTAGRALLRRGIPTMGDVFSAAGYATGIFGKWHLGDNYPYRPTDRGFQEAKYHLGFGISSAPDFDQRLLRRPLPRQGRRQALRRLLHRLLVRRSHEVDGRSAAPNAAPSSATCPPTRRTAPPGWPRSTPRPTRSRRRPRRFFGMIANLDENLGKLEDFLKKTGLRDNTIVVFMTDNGGTGGVQRLQRRHARPQDAGLRRRPPRALLRALARGPAGRAARYRRPRRRCRTCCPR